jgi:hypothetical protein
LLDGARCWRRTRAAGRRSARGNLVRRVVNGVVRHVMDRRAMMRRHPVCRGHRVVVDGLVVHCV